jgi:hypothetical protein
MATTPQYAATPKCPAININTANTALDGTGTVGTAYTAGSNGSRIDRIVIKATGTTTAGMIRLFIHDGSNYRLYHEVPVYAITQSGTVDTFLATLEAVNTPHLMPILLPTGYSLRASTNNAESFNIISVGGDN